jgi:hypothetical protein
MFTDFICIILFLFAFNVLPYNFYFAGTLGSNFQSHPKFIDFCSSLFSLQLNKLRRKAAACNNLVALISQAASPPRAFSVLITSKKICFKLSKYPAELFCSTWVPI